MNYPEFDGGQVCAQSDPELWFPTPEHQTGRLAKSLCRTCPWLNECLAYALRHDVNGIWGATTERERYLMRREQNITAEPMTFDSLFL